MIGTEPFCSRENFAGKRRSSEAETPFFVATSTNLSLTSGYLWFSETHHTMSEMMDKLLEA
jgi:hypothetical protein